MNPGDIVIPIAICCLAKTILSNGTRAKMNYQVALALSICCAMSIDAFADEPLAPADAAATCKVPEGFQVTVFAGEPDIRQPIGFCIDDRGRLWVAEAYSYPIHTESAAKDRIVILEDTNGDGQHDQRTVFYEGLNYVTGIEYGFGGVWVMTPPYMYFIPDRDGNDIPDGAPQLLLDGFGNHANAHNLANGFAWGPDGWLYGTHGRTNWSMIGKPGTSEAERTRFDGGVYRYHPVRHVWEAYADGTTNPWGIDWNDYGHAFITNCVNPHLFQVLQGAHYEPWRGRQSSQYAYQRIDTIADHLHFTGLSNIRSGHGSAEEDAAGGGHAHCGTMIYLGDNFPSKYRNTLFTNNVHGRRINNDIPRRIDSGYVASHAPDLLLATDPWFMGVTLAYGPAGEVYVSDWSDTGECHSRKNTRKQTGRIYRITYGETIPQQLDLASQTDLQLARLMLHDNDWFVRHARRLLQERSAAGADLAAVHHVLLDIFENDERVPKKLRALWALHATNGLNQEVLLNALSHSSEDVRSWSVTLLSESGQLTDKTKSRFINIAKRGNSPLVRLSLASALQRLRLAERWDLANALAGRAEDETDQNLPLMIWYGIEPLIQDDLQRFAELATNAQLSRVRINVARRIAESDQMNQGLELLTQQLTQTTKNSSVCENVLSGVLEGVRGKRRLPMPPSWRQAFNALTTLDSEQVQDQIVRLAVVFDDKEALARLREIANQPTYPTQRRTLAIETLVGQRVPGFENDLLQLLSDASLRSTVIRSLAAYSSERVPATILAHYNTLSEINRQDAQLTLASRPSWAMALLDAIDSKQINANDLTAYTVRQIQQLGNPALTERLGKQWGNLREASRDKAKQIQSIKRWLSEERLMEADLAHGKQLFTKHCASCHQLFGQGGKIGPDITGAQRQNLDYMLENIVDPSAAVAKDYQMEKILTEDGRVLTGLVTRETGELLTLQTVNEQVVVPIPELATREKSSSSIMPDGLLEPLSENQIRDLMGYLRSR